MARGLGLEAGDLDEPSSGGVQHPVPPVALFNLSDHDHGMRAINDTCIEVNISIQALTCCPTDVDTL